MSAMGVRATHIERHGFPENYADLAFLDYLERQAAARERERLTEDASTPSTHSTFDAREGDE